MPRATHCKGRSWRMQDIHITDQYQSFGIFTYSSQTSIYALIQSFISSGEAHLGNQLVVCNVQWWEQVMPWAGCLHARQIWRVSYSRVYSLMTYKPNPWYHDVKCHNLQHLLIFCVCRVNTEKWNVYSKTLFNSFFCHSCNLKMHSSSNRIMPEHMMLVLLYMLSNIFQLLYWHEHIWDRWWCLTSVSTPSCCIV